MAGEYNRLSAIQQLRVNAHIIEFFDRGSEDFIDNFQGAAKGVYQRDGNAGEAFQTVLDDLRDELASNWSELPLLANETSGLSAMRSQLRQVGSFIAGELESDSFYTAQHYASVITFFDDNPTSRPTRQADLPIAFLQEIQRSSGFISNAQQEAARLQQYLNAIDRGEYLEPSAEATAAASRVHTQLPDEVEAYAIEIAAKAFSISDFDATSLSVTIMPETGRTDIKDPNESRMAIALADVRQFLSEIDAPITEDRNYRPQVDSSDIVTQLTNVGQQVANNRDGNER